MSDSLDPTDFPKLTGTPNSAYLDPVAAAEIAETREELLAILRASYPKAADSLDFHVELLRFLAKAGGPIAKAAILFVAEEVVRETRK